MRWFALVSDAFGGSGGIAQYNRDLLSAVAASGLVHSIRVLPRHSTEVQQIPPLIHQMSPRGRAAFVLAAIATTLTRRVDVVFCGHIHFAPLARSIASGCGAKLVIQVHGVETWGRLRSSWRTAIENCDLVLSVSRHTRREVLRFSALPPERALVLSNTVSEAFTPGDRTCFRRELGIENSRILLTVGRMDSRERYKGQDRIISALPGLLASGLDVMYLIAGEGDDRARLEQLAREAGVRERVVFLGLLKLDRLVDAYRAADLFVMPSTGEGFGISFLEAMACGTPALGFAAGGAADALVDGHLGTVVSEHDLEASLVRILTSPKAADALLASEVDARFGRRVFQQQVNALVAELGRSRGGVDASAMLSVRAG
jgi:phosphatidylinositol alpha-1,6-mannosyltransferase